MPGISFGELILIMFVALMVFGPRRLPEIGRMIGKVLNELRKATDELKYTIDREVRADEFKQVTPANVLAPVQSISRTEPPTAEPLHVVPDEPAVETEPMHATEPAESVSLHDSHPSMPEPSQAE
jgi:sec-independent protein translocase protein TatB